MFMLLFFGVIGFTFYRLFLKSPFEQKRVIKTNPSSTITKQKAADFSA